MDKIAKALDKALKEQEDERKAGPVKVAKGPTLAAVAGHNMDKVSGPVGEELEDSFFDTTGDLPKEPQVSSIDPKLIVYHEPESLAAEHFKLLRSRILHPSDGRELRTILVTSAMDDAGKTMVACNLALSIAQGVDPYALLIDADVRRSSVHKMFGLDPGIGLTDYLVGRESLPACFVKPAISKLTILPSGEKVPNPAEIITSSRMKALLDEAKARYEDRFIIIDSPPVNLASEVIDLTKLVDTVLLVVRCGGASKPFIEQAINRLGKDRIMGIVFNAYDRPSGKYGYYKQKNSYYS